MFRSKFSEDIFNQKYKHERAETWEQLAETLVKDVNGTLDIYQPGVIISNNDGHLSKTEEDQLIQYIKELKFIPGGR